MQQWALRGLRAEEHPTFLRCVRRELRETRLKDRGARIPAKGGKEFARAAVREAEGKAFPSPERGREHFEKSIVRRCADSCEALPLLVGQPRQSQQQIASRADDAAGTRPQVNCGRVLHPLPTMFERLHAGSSGACIVDKRSKQRAHVSNPSGADDRSASVRLSRVGSIGEIAPPHGKRYELVPATKPCRLMKKIRNARGANEHGAGLASCSTSSEGGVATTVSISRFANAPVIPGGDMLDR